MPKDYAIDDRTHFDAADLRRLFDLTGRVAVVTGGTRGIGRALAEGLAAAGAKVVVASRRAEACATTEKALLDAGAEAMGVSMHMGDLDAIDDLVTRTVDRFGGLDILVNNAATALAMPVTDFTPEAWEKSYSVNLRGPIFLAKAAFPHLKAGGHGAVLHVISAGAFLFSPGLGMYNGAKTAMLGYTRNMAAEWAPHGIRVNALAPGTIDTDMVRNNTPERVESMSQACLLKRIASANEMIGPALFLVSDAASYVTGQVVVADGGLVPGR
jgi:NAD(P)-dependent dehydrogenase (short-subunit alcohol dehydrogenase family)